MSVPHGNSSACARTARRAFCLVFFPALAVAQSDASPDSAGQERILQAVRQYAANYRLPDMTYDQSFDEFHPDGAPGTWRKTSSGESQVIAHNGREYHCCRMGRNRKPVPNQWVQTWYIPGYGEFPWDGTIAGTAWNRWDVVRGHRVAVFDYTVRARDSRAILPYRHGTAGIPRADGNLWSGPVTDMRDSAALPYSGSIWVDPATGAIWRHSTLTTEFPARFKLRSSSVTIDYDLVTLGTEQYLLDVMKVDVTASLTGTSRYEWLYRNHRIFAADSSIMFIGPDSAVTPGH